MTPGNRAPADAMVVPFWVNATTRGALMSKLVARVASVPWDALLGVLALPVSSNSTVKG
jgi:hypothetical protein